MPLTFSYTKKIFKRGLPNRERYGILRPVDSPVYLKDDSLAQSVEHLTFNQGVPDSSSGRITITRRHRQEVKTPPFHGGFVGSNPAGVTNAAR